MIPFSMSAQRTVPLALLLAVSAMFAATVAAGEPQVRITSDTSKGFCRLVVGSENLVSLAENGEPVIKLECTLHPPGGGKPRFVEPKRLKASFDFQKQRAVVQYNVGVLAADYKLDGNRLACSLSLQNRSDAGMQFHIRALDLKTLLNYWNCQGEWFGTSWAYSAPGCKVGVFVHGDFSGEYRKCYTDRQGFTPLCVTNRAPRVAKHPVVDNAWLSDLGSLVAPAPRPSLS